MVYQTRLVGFPDFETGVAMAKKNQEPEGIGMAVPVFLHFCFFHLYFSKPCFRFWSIRTDPSG